MPDIGDLRQKQALPLGAKVLMTQNRIREWYDHWNGNVYISFSGGKDSTVLARLVHDMYPDVPLVFSNTGLEYPEIQAFAKKMGAVFIRPKMRFDEVLTEYGYPIISKEVSEAIYYARRIRGGGGYGKESERRRDDLQTLENLRTTHTVHKRLDLTGKRIFERFQTTDRKRGQINGDFNKQGEHIESRGGGGTQKDLKQSDEGCSPG